jgi:hypothetical protein
MTEDLIKKALEGFGAAFKDVAWCIENGEAT